MRRYVGALTLAALVAVFVVGSLIGFKLLFTKAPPLQTDAQDAASGCVQRTIKSGARLASSQVTVNVFNASSTSGLANRTLINLQAHGFTPGTVANAPKGVATRNVMVVTRDRTTPSVRLVAAQFKGKVAYSAPTATLPAGVQVVIGPKYKGLKKKYPKATTANKATQVCIQVDNSDATK